MESESDDKEKLKESYKQIGNLNNKIERLELKLDGYYQKKEEYYKAKKILENYTIRILLTQKEILLNKFSFYEFLKESFYL